MMRIRKSNVKYDQWDDLYDCLDQMIHGSKVFIKFLKIHMRPGTVGMYHRMHGQSGEVGYNRFLPWHRAFLLEFENEMRKIKKDITLPYWDWLADGPNLTGIKSLDRLNPNNSIWTRDTFHTFPIRDQDVKHLVENVRDYYQFSYQFERGPHVQGHDWAGGDMQVMMSSPRDPLFYFHHANVDRLWFEWQKRNPDKRAKLSKPDNLLDPWQTKYNIDNIDNIIQLGADSYLYD